MKLDDKKYLLYAGDGPEGIEIYTSEERGVVDWAEGLPALYASIAINGASAQFGPFHLIRNQVQSQIDVQAILESRFPWLKEDEDGSVSGADVIDELGAWYEDLKKSGGVVVPRTRKHYYSCGCVLNERNVGEPRSEKHGHPCGRHGGNF